MDTVSLGGLITSRQGLGCMGMSGEIYGSAAAAPPAAAPPSGRRSPLLVTVRCYRRPACWGMLGSCS